MKMVRGSGSGSKKDLAKKKAPVKKNLPVKKAPTKKKVAQKREGSCSDRANLHHSLQGGCSLQSTGVRSLS